MARQVKTSSSTFRLHSRIDHERSRNVFTQSTDYQQSKGGEFDQTEPFDYIQSLSFGCSGNGAALSDRKLGPGSVSIPGGTAVMISDFSHHRSV